MNVIPNSKRPKIIKTAENKFKVRVDAPPIKNKANKRLIEIISAYFNVKKSQIKIIYGLNSRSKRIEIEQFR
ncbi:MAG: DUF167 domain-containing protein [Nitrososphaeria archaeon]